MALSAESTPAKIVAQIKYTDKDNKQHTILLDAINDTSVNLNATATMHPLPTGESVADHMYQNPATETLSGVFSLDGSSVLSRFISKSDTALASLQSEFEGIQKNAYRCSILKITAGNQGTRFLQRDNMVLTGISWTEGINTLSFSFNFLEIMVAEVEKINADVSDSFLPELSDLKRANFTDVFLDWNDTFAIVQKWLKDNDLIEEEFLNDLARAGASAALKATVTTAVGAVAAAKLLSVSLANPVVLAVVGGVAVASALAWFILGAIQASQKSEIYKKYRDKVFKHYADDERNKKEVERYYNFQGAIHQSVYALNGVIQCWQFTSDESHEALLTMGDNNYTVTVYKYLKQNKISFTFRDAYTGEMVKYTTNESAKTNFNDCNTNNAMFRLPGTGEYVYLVRLTGGSSGPAQDPNNPVFTEKDKVTDFAVLSTAINPEQFNELLNTIIEDSFAM